MYLADRLLRLRPWSRPGRALVRSLSTTNVVGVAVPESARARGALRRVRPVLGRVAPPWLVPRPVRPLLVWVARLTTASVVAYLLTVWLIDGPIDRSEERRVGEGWKCRLSSRW